MRITMGIGQGLAAITLGCATFIAYATPGTSYYIYDESGHVIGEHDANANPIQLDVCLGDRPMAVVQGSSGGTVDTYPRTSFYAARVT